MCAWILDGLTALLMVRSLTVSRFPALLCGTWVCAFRWDIMDRQIRRLEIELQKFKTDLEAKQPGITEQLLQGES